MVLGDTGGGRKRRKKYTDDSHKKNAEKQALWRRRHPDKYEAYKERMRMQTRMDKGAHQAGGFLVYERVTPEGEILALRIRHHLERPDDDERLSDFLPHSPVEYGLATALRDSRLKQLAEWRGEC